MVERFLCKKEVKSPILFAGSKNKNSLNPFRAVFVFGERIGLERGSGKSGVSPCRKLFKTEGFERAKRRSLLFAGSLEPV